MSAPTRTVSGRWLRRFHQPAEPRICRLLSLPHAGGSASYFFPFSRALADDLDVLVAQYPGRQERHGEPLIDDIREMAARITETLVDNGLTDLPVALFGHSMGALVGYEVACLLADRELPVRWLFASACRAPTRLQGRPVRSTDDAIVADLLALGGTDAAVLDDPALRELILPVLRSDSHAVDAYRYRPRPPLAVPVTTLWGTGDPRVDRADAEAWSEISAGRHELRAFPGGHFYLSEPEHLATVTALVRDRLRTPARPTTA